MNVKVYDHETAGNLVYTSGFPQNGTIVMSGDFLDSTKNYFISYYSEGAESKRYEIERSSDVSYLIDSPGNIRFLDVPSGATVFIFIQPYLYSAASAQTNMEDETKDIALTYDHTRTRFLGIKEKGKAMSKIVHLLD